MSLRNAPASHRAFATAVILVIGLGYALAQVYLFSQKVKPMMDQGHGLVEGVGYTYNGMPSAEPRILVSLKGSMASTVSSAEYDAIKRWIDEEATQQGYAGAVANIIEKNCASCHGPNGYPPLVTNFEDTLPLTEPDSGMDIKKLARMTHIHVLGIPMVLFMLGVLFIRTRFPERIKVLLVILPFLGVVWDIAYWWLTKLDSSAAIGIVFGGALMGTGVGLQLVLTMYDVWMPYKQTGESETGIA
jgi:hypothetical protein